MCYTVISNCTLRMILAWTLILTYCITDNNSNGLLTTLIHTKLHWLDVPDRVTYKLGLLMHRCLQGTAPNYLIDCCTPVSDVVGRQRLRSASRLQLVVPRHRLTTLGRRAFAVMGPTVWNLLPDDVRAQQNSDSFCRHLKTFLFSHYYRIQRIRDVLWSYDNALYKSILHYITLHYIAVWKSRTSK